MRRSWISIMKRLTALVGSLLPVMAVTIILGVMGFLCAIFLTIFGAFALLNLAGFETAWSASGLLAGVVFCAVLRGLLRYGEQLSGHYLAFKLLAVLRDKVFYALRRLAPAKLESRDKGNLISLITSDIELLEVFYAHTMAPVAIALITSLFMTLFIGAQSAVLGVLAAAAYITVGVVIPVVNSKTGKERGAEYRTAFGSANTYFLDSLLGIKEIIRYGQGESRKATIEQITGDLDKKQELLKRREGMTKAAADGAILLFSAAVLLTGLALMQLNQLEFEGMVIATVAMLSSFGPVVAISSLSNNLLQTMASGERVLDILEEEPQTPEAEGGGDLLFQGACCENVGFAYDKEKILQDVNLDIPEKGVIGICGKSGSGKSTLLKLLMRFWDVGEGSIQISGKDIRRINTKNLRRMEGYVTQDTFLFDTTIEDNIRVANPRSGREQVEKAAESAGIHDFILSLPEGYRTNVGELGDRLSSGERQRIGVARAFLHNAPFILLDEPTSNLDSLNEAIILHALQQQSKEKAIVLVSHRDSAMRIADKIYRMKRGRVS